jgi:hypothetical protein
MVLKQLWQNGIPQSITSTGFPLFCVADGESIWVASYGTVDRVQPSTGKILATWTGATGSWPILAIPGFVITADNGTSGNLYYFDPSLPPGTVVATSVLPSGPSSLAFDGLNIWTANFSGSVTTYSSGTPHNHSAGFTQPVGLVYDGTHMWVTDYGAGKLFRVDAAGTITSKVTVGMGPEQPAFDGENIWVPNYLDNSISVVQASSSAVVATIASDGINLLSGPEQASFDGERMLVTNATGNSVTIFKAADLSVIANIFIGVPPYGACSDGVNFWVAISGSHFLMRF